MQFDREGVMIEESPATRASGSQPPSLRLIRPKDGPTVSVVLATRKARAELADALPPLVLACSQLGADLIIATADTGAQPARVPTRHVKYIGVPADAPTSHMRALAMGQVTGDIVVLLDDDASSPGAWVDRVRQVVRRATSPDADDAGERAAIDWMAYLSRDFAQAH